VVAREDVGGSRWSDCEVDSVVWDAGRILLEWWIAEDWSASDVSWVLYESSHRRVVCGHQVSLLLNCPRLRALHRDR
jgi:hypothetical protein